MCFHASLIRSSSEPPRLHNNWQVFLGLMTLDLQAVGETDYEKSLRLYRKVWSFLCCQIALLFRGLAITLCSVQFNLNPIHDCPHTGGWISDVGLRIFLLDWGASVHRHVQEVKAAEVSFRLQVHKSKAEE